MQPEESTLPGGVTAADHEAGFKDLTVLLRTGAREALRLHAPPALDALTLYRASLNGQDVTNQLLQQAVKAEHRAILDKMDVDSLAEALGVAMALAWGMEKQKKMLAAAEAIFARPIPTGSSTNGGLNGSPWRARAWAWLKRRIGRGRG